MTLLSTKKTCRFAALGVGSSGCASGETFQAPDPVPTDEIARCSLEGRVADNRFDIYLQAHGLSLYFGQAPRSLGTSLEGGFLER